MAPAELAVVVLAIVVAGLGTPLLGRLLARAWPPSISSETDSALRRTRRNPAIEYLGVVFFIAGMAVPFVIHRTDSLAPTIGNVALVIAFGFLFMIGGILCLIKLFGGVGAESFLDYFERERGISSTGVRRIAMVGSILSGVAILIVVLSTR